MYSKSLAIMILFILVSKLASSEERFSKKALHNLSPVRTLSGDHLKEVAFPLGGIGTGNITLGGRGELRDWEIFNRPGKGKQPNFSFFAIWARRAGDKPVAKILERKLFPPYTGWMGIPRQTLSGVARFDDVEFKGEYPFAWLSFQDAALPVAVQLEAYNPMIPLNAEDSGIPVAIFNWIVANPSSEPAEVAISFSLQNPIGTDGKDFGSRLVKSGVNEAIDLEWIRGIKFSSNDLKPDDVNYGTMAMVTSEQNINVQTSWYRGGWWDNAHIFWDDFSDDGKITDKRARVISPENSTDVASLIVRIALPPHAKKIIPFYLTWHLPQRENYWNREESVRGKKMKNYYAQKFADAVAVASYVTKNLGDLERTTRLFHQSLFGSTLPDYVLDAVSSQASILKTNTVLRVDDGKFFGFEGLSDDGGCCPMDCSHVWNYAQTVAYLYPALERSTRETDFLYNTFGNGYMVFRTLIPLGDHWWQFKPCADGQMGAIVRAYREWKISGDNAWLQQIYPAIKKSLEFAWNGVGTVSEDLKWQKDQMALAWDANKDGVMEGEQHNTYDIEFYGPNTMTGAIYLTALKAASEMATAMGDNAAAKQYTKIFQSGSQKYDQQLWNGAYYIQEVRVEPGLKVPDWLQTPKEERACACKSSPGGKKKALEHDLIPKYQYGKGCLSDQLLGQYEAFVTGLGYVMNPAHVKQALKSIFDYNFKTDLSDFSNVQRVYALNDEAGLLLCSWPQGDRPKLPFVYSDEVWTGIEYQVAASLIYAGWIDEGLTIVKAIRDRHDGLRRNPWDEFECGHHYARAMASWAVLLALSGFQYDGIAQSMAFAPAINAENFQVFWSCGTGWGTFSMNNATASLRVQFGKVELQKFSLKSKSKIETIQIAETSIPFKSRKEDDFISIHFKNSIQIQAGAALTVTMKK